MRHRTVFPSISALGLLLVLAAPTPAATERIAGGVPTTATWPAQAFVKTPYGGCGGTLVSARHVLTAAHCVTNADGGVWSAASMSLIIGRTELAGATAADTYGVTPGGVTRHGAFQESYGGLSNDLARCGSTGPRRLSRCGS